MEEWLERYPPLKRDLASKNHSELGAKASSSPRRREIKLPLLDLHGYTRAEAEELLEHTIARVPADSFARLPVAHGKGLHSPECRPVLPALVAEVAKRHPRVQRFTHPPEREGGRGVSILFILPQKK